MKAAEARMSDVLWRHRRDHVTAYRINSVVYFISYSIHLIDTVAPGWRGNKGDHLPWAALCRGHAPSRT